MSTSIKFTALATLLLSASGFAATADAPPSLYAGQQTRSIKSLSDQEVASLLSGKGAGLAKAAELNGYPGPAHVLELAAPLQLSALQVEASRQLMTAHQSRASRLGVELVAAERELDALFAQRRADAATIDRATQRVGALQAQVRAEHLTTHLTQTALLTAEQIHRYSVLRGYASVDPDAAPESDSAPQGSAGHHH